MDNHELIKSQIIAEMVISQGDKVVMMVNNMLNLYLQNMHQDSHQDTYQNMNQNHNSSEILGSFISTGSNQPFEHSNQQFEKANSTDIFTVTKPSRKSKRKNTYSEQEQELRKNAYLKFKAEKFNRISALYSGRSASYISNQVLYHWRRLSPDERDSYID